MNRTKSMLFLGSILGSKVTADDIDIDWSDDGLAEKQAASYLIAYVSGLENIIRNRASNADLVISRIQGNAEEVAMLTEIAPETEEEKVK